MKRSLTIVAIFCFMNSFAQDDIVFKDEYPFNEIQNQIKIKADKLIRSVYGDDFFNKYIT